MRAVVHGRYGDPADLVVRDLPVPEPGPDEVLVRVRAASVHPDVWHVVTGRPYVLRLMGSGLRRPKVSVPGTDLAGVVERVGGSVTRFRPGDEVFGEAIRGVQWVNGATYAELACAPEEGLAVKPADASFEEAATVPTAGLIALQNLASVGQVRPGERVLVNGAAGGVGGLAVQLAVAAGAVVTGVDSAAKEDVVRRLGAERFVDFTTVDFTREADRYDLVFDVPGNHPLRAVRRVIAPGGRYVLIGHDAFGTAGRRWLGSIPRFVRLMAMSFFVRELPRPDFAAQDKAIAMARLADLLAEGRLTPVIDRAFPLEEAAQALGYLASGQARGRVVLTVS
ncbi:MAG: NAD(P)-dependent alcohol dehydrogenase [Marmoricola sp.]